jgi:hypothetical protein
MTPAREGSVLLGALLDRIGATQSQVLLVRIDKWLASAAHPNTNGFDQDQIRALQAPYDRRRQNGNGIQFRHSNAASIDAKG